MKSISITKRTSGGYTIIVDGSERQHSSYNYIAFIEGIILFDCSGKAINDTPYDHTLWTVNDVTDIATDEEVCNALDRLGLEHKTNGVPGGCVAVTPHDTNMLSHVGWIEVRGNAGNVAIVDAYGNASLVLAFDSKETSKMLVSRVLATGTTATDIYLYY